MSSRRTFRKASWSGSLTVFFSLTGVFLLCLLCSVLEAVRIQGARAQTASIMGIADFSVLAEYEKNLLEEFEIFALDGAGGSGSFQIQKTEGRLRHFLNLNTEPLDGESQRLLDPWNLCLTDCAIQSYALLTDDQGEPFYQQAVAYMKANPQVLAGELEKTDQKMLQELEKLGKEYEQKQKENDTRLNELEREKKQQEQQQSEEHAPESEPQQEVTVKNPLTALGGLKRKGTLALVTGGAALSDETIQTGALPSRGRLQSGTRKLKRTYQGMVCDAWFREYLLSFFPNYCGEAKEELKYQAEYLLVGKPSDQRNLKQVVKRLLLLREGLNYRYCLTNPGISGRAEKLALALTGGFGIPALTAATRHALLLGIAYGESLLDVRTLLANGKVPLIKDETSWRLSFEMLGELGNLLKAEDGRGGADGLDYTDYLRLLMQTTKRSDLKLRALDLIQYRMQKRSGSEGFQAQNAIVAIEAEASWRCQPVFYSLPQAIFGLGNGGTGIEQGGSMAY